jgi:hypothetical protein
MVIVGIGHLRPHYNFACTPLVAIERKLFLALPHDVLAGLFLS